MAFFGIHFHSRWCVAYVYAAGALPSSCLTDFVDIFKVVGGRDILNVWKSGSAATLFMHECVCVYSHKKVIILIATTTTPFAHSPSQIWRATRCFIYSNGTPLLMLATSIQNIITFW